MIHFSYSFCMAMLHSLWQAALLLLLYVAVDKLIHKNNAPLAKRNILYAILLTQLTLFAFTFSVYFFNTLNPGNFTALTESIAAYTGLSNIQAATPWLFTAYIIALIYKLIKAFVSWQQFKQQYKTGLQKPAVELKLFTQLKAHQFGIKRKVKVWLSNTVQTPVTFGFFKPVILLPVALVNNISLRQAETLILHELAHIRTNDYLLNWFLLTAESLFFFNPFIITVCQTIRLEREKNCDLHVLAFEYSPALYAETLLQAELMKQPTPAFQLAAVNQKKYLLQRIQYFTKKETINQTLRFNIVAPLIGLILLFFLSVSVLFQSGKSVLPVNSATSIPYLPINNYLVSDIDFGKNVLPDEEDKIKQVTETETARPVINTDIPETIIQPQPLPATEIIE
ncbi:MAG: M56 family metallopeptidase, partial [Ferruginibacter sp.]